jgi:hypothetical protein
MPGLANPVAPYVIKAPTEQEMEVWKMVYISNNYPDPHAVFAKALELPRHEAKKRCYEILYTVDFLRPLVDQMSGGSLKYVIE